VFRVVTYTNMAVRWYNVTQVPAGESDTLFGWCNQGFIYSLRASG